MLAIGTVVTIVGYHAKDHSKRAWGRDITFPDGRTIYMGSGKKPTGPAPPPPAAPRSPLVYILGVPGVVLAAGLVLLWRRRLDQRGRVAR
jgi:hypothetical protein